MLSSETLYSTDGTQPENSEGETRGSMFEKRSENPTGHGLLYLNTSFGRKPRTCQISTTSFSYSFFLCWGTITSLLQSPSHSLGLPKGIGGKGLSNSMNLCQWPLFPKYNTKQTRVANCICSHIRVSFLAPEPSDCIRYTSEQFENRLI